MADSTHNIWLAATLAEGAVVFHRPAQPGPNQPGTLGQQFALARLAADNPWGFVHPDDAWHAARRTILHHARRPAA
jgi:hypothetical protein